MSQQLFEVSGISLDNTISILYGVSVPGISQETIEAPQGSVYFATDGITWKKIAAGTGSDKWSQAAGGGSVVSGINSLRNVTGNVVVDSLNATDIDTGVWAITTSSVADPLNHQTVIVTGSHNTAVAKYSLYSRMDFGTKIQGITYDVRLSNGSFDLVVFAPIFCNIDCYRLNAISNGSTVTLVTNGGGGGGSGDVTTAQLNAEIAARQAADTALNTLVSGKADITGLATQFININTNITTVSDALATETAARIAADIALQATIDSVPTNNTVDFLATLFGTPIVSQVIGMQMVARNCTFSGGYAKAANAPTSNSVFTVMLNGTPSGTITFDAGSAVGVVDIPSINVSAGDFVQLFSPSLICVISDAAFVIKGSLS